MSDFFSQFQSVSFWNGFGIFTGIVAGALIQHALGMLNQRKQAKNALAVMQTEIAYNRSEVTAFKERIDWLKQRIAANQIDEVDLFLPMQKFDYSSIGPLTNAGYFHVLLGPEKVRAYLEFYHFFRIENGAQLTTMLKSEHQDGRSMAFLEWAEGRATELVGKLESIEHSTLAPLQLKLRPPKRNRIPGIFYSLLPNSVGQRPCAPPVRT